MASLRSLATVLATFLILTFAADGVWYAVFPSQPRVTTDFSATYLEREMKRSATFTPQIVFSGDSVLWGYRLPIAETAAARLRVRGYPIDNLAFEGGSPANTYAILRLLLDAGVRPRQFVFNVNQKEFNPEDSAYDRLHPALNEAAAAKLSRDDVKSLVMPVRPPTIDSAIDRAVTRASSLYAMRADMRETLFGDVDASHALDGLIRRASGSAARAELAHRPTSDRFAGTYALDPLDEQNVSVHFLRRTIALLQVHRIRALAILTPTNHQLLHDFIDVPAYVSNLSYVSRLLSKGGVRVLDLDRRFAPDEFLDNDHLTAGGNAKLASILEPELAR